MNNQTTDRALVLVELLGAVAGAAWQALDNGEGSADGGCIVPPHENAALSTALDNCDRLPQLGDGYVRDGWLLALTELRALLAKPAECETCRGAHKVRIHTVCGPTDKACNQCAPAVQPQGEPVGIEGMPQYLILFDDTERPVETMFGEDIARKRYAAVSMSWNAHLFVKIDSNSRDAMFANNNATICRHQAEPEREDQNRASLIYDMGFRRDMRDMQAEQPAPAGLELAGWQYRHDAEHECGIAKNYLETTGYTDKPDFPGIREVTPLYKLTAEQPAPGASVTGMISGGDATHNTVTVCVNGGVPSALWTLGEPVTLTHGAGGKDHA